MWPFSKKQTSEVDLGPLRKAAARIAVESAERTRDIERSLQEWQNVVDAARAEFIQTVRQRCTSEQDFRKFLGATSRLRYYPTEESFNPENSFDWNLGPEVSFQVSPRFIDLYSQHGISHCVRQLQLFAGLHSGLSRFEGFIDTETQEIVCFEALLGSVNVGFWSEWK